MADRDLIPANDLVALDKLVGKLGKYPLYGFLLYSTVDKDFSDYIASDKGRWLHRITGDDCLIAVFENPAPWGPKYEEYWKKTLGENFSDIAAKWKDIAAEDRDLSYELADKLNVDKNALPCLVFIKDFQSNEILYIPIITNKDEYTNYFKDIAKIVHDAREIEGDKKLALKDLQPNRGLKLFLFLKATLIRP